MPVGRRFFYDLVLGDPIAYAQCEQIPGSDTPLTLPVYTLASGLSYMPGQSLVQTVLALGVSSRPEGWSSSTAQSAGMAGEGPSVRLLSDVFWAFRIL